MLVGGWTAQPGGLWLRACSHHRSLVGKCPGGSTVLGLVVENLEV